MSGDEEQGARRRGGPYKGLDRFDEDDWRLFFGRTRERDVIITNLRARRVTLLYGASGVGKSSLLHAGVAHHLHELALKNVREVGVPEFVPVIVSAWRDDPVGTVRRALLGALAEFTGDAPPADGSLADTIEQLAASVDSRLLVVLDQLEEYYLYHGRPAGDDPLGPELADALTRERLRASFLLSVREDALAKLDPLRRQVPGLFNSVLHLEPLDRENAAAAIVEPLAHYRGPGPHQAEPRLVDVLLDQLAGDTPVPEQAGQGRIGPHDERIDPSYLQMVLSSLWEREQDEHRLRLATLEELGGAEAIARRHLDEALDALPTRERDLAAEALRFLVTPLGAKIALAAEELGSFTGEDLAETLEQLAGSARVLRTVSSLSGEDEPTRYEIFHDVLGPAVLDWRARYVRERERLELEREAEEAREREREERHRARVFRTLALGALTALVCALAALGYAWYEKNSADRQRRAAESRAMAADAVGLLPSRLDEGVTRALAARDRANTFEARRAVLLASRATDGLVRFLRFRSRPTALADDGRGFVVALETGALVVLDRDGRRSGGWGGEQRTVSAVVHDPRRPRVVVGGQQSVEFLDERRLAGGRIDLRRRAAVQVADSQLSVHALAIDGGGRLLAAGGEGGITVWRLDGRGLPLESFRETSVRDVTSLAFEHGGAELLATTPSGRLRFDLRGSGLVRTGAPPATGPRFADHIDAPVATAVDQQARFVAGADGTGRIGLWSTAAGSPFVRLFLGQGDKVVGLVFDSSGRRLAAASRDGTVAVWSVAQVANVAAVDAAPVAGQRVAVVTPTGSLELRRLDGTTSRPVAGGAEQVAASADGRHIVSAGADGALAAAYDGTHVIRFARGVHLGDAAIADDGRIVGRLGADPRVAMWDDRGRPGRILEPPASLVAASVTTVTISPDGRRVAAGYYTQARKGAVVLWRDGRASTPIGYATPVTALAFDRSGSVVAVGEDGGRIEIRRLSNGAVTSLVAHATTVTALAFSRDGRMLVSGSDDGVVRLSDIESGGQLDELVGHGSPSVAHVGFSPDGRTLVATHGSLNVWNTETWRLDSAPIREHLCSLLDNADRTASGCS